MAAVDLCFPVVGDSLPVDHGYALYAAISRALGPASHATTAIGVFPVPGLTGPPHTLKLTGRSCLRVRTPLEHIPVVLPLAGRQLDVDGHRIGLGVPRTLALTPAATLHSRIVTIKGFKEPQPFLDAVRRQLDDLGVSGRPAIPIRTAAKHEGEPARRVLRIKGKKVVGFALIVSELTAEESLTVQEKGLGGRRHMGCGLLLPLKARG